MRCPYCQDTASFSPSSAHIYGGREFGPVYECRPCGAYVGCHKGTTDALGTPANAEDRSLRKGGHGEFDKLWKKHGWSRRRAYRWLAQAMNITQDEAHFGHMNGARLERAVQVSVAKVREIELSLDEGDAAELEAWLEAF